MIPNEEICYININAYKVDSEDNLYYTLIAEYANLMKLEINGYDLRAGFLLMIEMVECYNPDVMIFLVDNTGEREQLISELNMAGIINYEFLQA